LQNYYLQKGDFYLLKQIYKNTKIVKKLFFTTVNIYYLLLLIVY